MKEILGLHHVNVDNFKSKVIDVTPTLDTSAYAADDILFDFTDIDLGEGDSNVRGSITGFTLIDKDDQGSQITLFFSDDDAATLGTFNTAVTITDAHAAMILGYVDTGATYEDLVDSQIIKPAAFTPIPFDVSNGRIYVGGVIRSGTPTHTASGIVLRLHVTIELLELNN